MTTGQDHEMNERQEIEMLLPWYATGKLDAADRARVDSYISAHPEIRRLAELASEEADVSFAVNEAIQPPSPAVLEKLLTRIEAEPRQVAKRAASGLWERCVAWIDGFAPSTLALAGAAAALLLVAQAASIGALLLERQGSAEFHTASGSATIADKGTFALVVFSPNATAEAITSFLTESGTEIVEGPRAGGIYRIRLSRDVVDAPSSAAAVDKFRARRDLISFMSVTK